MLNKNFAAVAATEANSNWQILTGRENELYSRPDEIRSPFARDYTRILHSLAYRRLKHKTQVFFNINNDHICTRMEHVGHVESVSSTIAKALGLNEELTRAISIGHDLGHAPFGHQGETVLKKLSLKYLGKDFWHERNGLRFVDELELLEGDDNSSRNLNLTYAVRDGIISHCGEIDQNGIFPRDISIPISDFDCAGKYQAVTWEGCIVKIADKIAYLGRDIEDACRLGFIDEPERNELLKIARANDQSILNTTVIMHNMIIDICRSSSPENGIAMSEQGNKQMAEIKEFNYKHIYRNKLLDPFIRYSELVLTQIFETLAELYGNSDTLNNFDGVRKYYPKLIGSFEKWLARYCSAEIIREGPLKDIALACKNKKVYKELETEGLYCQAIIDYISGMTDRYAIELFNEFLDY